MITGTFNKIPRKKNSHGYGWAQNMGRESYDNN